MELNEIVSNPTLNGLLLALLASSALITFLNDALAQAVSRIPIIGGLLAMLVRRATPAFWTWLENQVASAAERAVREADAVATKVLPTPSGAERAQIAAAALQRAEPGLSETQATTAIEAAYQRIKADAARNAEAAAELAPVQEPRASSSRLRPEAR